MATETTYKLVKEDNIEKFTPVEVEKGGAMDFKKVLFWTAALVGGWYLLKRSGILNRISLGQVSRLPERSQFWPQETTYQGLGANGIPRRGNPKTEAERRATHQSLFGDGELPPRGTGLNRRGL